MEMSISLRVHGCDERTDHHAVTFVTMPPKLTFMITATEILLV